MIKKRKAREKKIVSGLKQRKERKKKEWKNSTSGLCTLLQRTLPIPSKRS